MHSFIIIFHHFWAYTYDSWWHSFWGGASKHWRQKRTQITIGQNEMMYDDVSWWERPSLHKGVILFFYRTLLLPFLFLQMSAKCLLCMLAHWKHIYYTSGSQSVLELVPNGVTLRVYKWNKYLYTVRVMRVLEIKRFENHCTKWNRALISIIGNTCEGSREAVRKYEQLLCVHTAHFFPIWSLYSQISGFPGGTGKRSPCFHMQCFCNPQTYRYTFGDFSCQVLSLYYCTVKSWVFI